MFGQRSVTAKRVLGASALLASATLTLSACDGDEAADSPTASATEATASASVEPAAQAAAEQAQAGEAGPYAVGQRTITFADPAGGDLTADIWYPVDPADTSQGTPTEYAFLPGLGYTSDIAFTEAPAADGEFPLLVYSHGGGGFRWVATFFTEFMASKGYVVVAPDHPGSTALDQLSGAGVDSETNANTRPPDVSATIDAVLAADADAADPLAGRVDEDSIALSGHSWGGFTSLAMVSGHTNALGTTAPDPRAKALVLMAPYTEMLSDAELESVNLPTLILSSTTDIATPIESNTERPAALIAGRPLLRLDFQGGSHNSFTDVCRLRDAVADNPDVPGPITAELDSGAELTCNPDVLDVSVIHDITNTYSAAFLAQEVQESTEYEQMLACVSPPQETVCTVKP